MRWTSGHLCLQCHRYFHQRSRYLLSSGADGEVRRQVPLPERCLARGTHSVQLGVDIVGNGYRRHCGLCSRPPHLHSLWWVGGNVHRGSQVQVNPVVLQTQSSRSSSEDGGRLSAEGGTGHLGSKTCHLSGSRICLAPRSTSRALLQGRKLPVQQPAPLPQFARTRSGAYLS